MKKIVFIYLILSFFLYSETGEVVNGFRTIDLTKPIDTITVYRGDYVSFIFNENEKILIPHLKLELSRDNNSTVKFKEPGEFILNINSESKLLRVLEYIEEGYREVDSKTFKEYIDNLNPIIIDVRTPGEYEVGHIENSILIPLQNLNKRINEISKYKNETVLIYCRSGNRSTVASKILIDLDFKTIINLRHGIIQWEDSGYKVVK